MIVIKGEMMMIIDTHSHLNMDEFKDDLFDVLERAKNHDVGHILVIGMDEPSNHRAILLAHENDMLYATVGVHPGYVETATTNHVKDLLKKDKVVAIGECGLDFYWETNNKDLQIKVFNEHIQLSVETGLPLIIHTRNSFEEAYQCLLPYQGKVTGVFHCFSSDLADAKRAIHLGFMIGIDGPVTFKNNKILHELITEIDLSHILVETDSPYMTPHPFRGKRNEPSYVRFVVEKIAEIKEMTVEEVKEITTQNAIRLFKLGGITR
jgi:TatD DNase family protein